MIPHPFHRPSPAMAALLALVSTTLLPAAEKPTAEVTEGPYHPFNSTNTLPPIPPASRDHDLTRVAGDTTPARGKPFLLSGRVRDVAGQPLEGLTVELWQTDSGGVYYHSGDRNIASRDVHFQFYGESTTGPDGAYSFRTVKPGLYSGRIRHFHFKVKRGDATLLTSQFTFDDERADFSKDGVQRRLSGEELESTVITPRDSTDEQGVAVWVATKDIIIDPNAKSAGRGESPKSGKRKAGR